MRNRMFILIVFFLGLVFIGGFWVLAQDADALAKQASAELRAAERSMFSGKIQEAQQQLLKAGELIEQLKAADPEHRNLRSLENKYTKLQKDIERRLPKSGVTTKAVEDKAKAESPDEKLPGGVTKRIKDIEAQLEFLRRYMARDHLGSPETTIKQAERYLIKSQDILSEIESRYGDQIPPDHPEMIAVKKKMVEAEKETERFAEQIKAGASKSDEKPAPTGDVAQALEDGKRVEALYDRHYDEMSLIHGNTLVYGPRLEDAEKAWQQIDAVETTILPEIEPALAEMAERYGTKPMEINNNLFKVGVKGRDQFGTKLGYLIEAAENVVKSRRTSAESIAQNAENTISGIEGLVPDIRVKRMEETKAILLIGQKLNPNNKKINEMLAQIGYQIDDIAQKIEADIDAKTWAGHVDRFEGPGSVKSLARAAKEYFENDSRWGKNPQKKVEILAVAVRGDWQVAEKDIFGRVIQWRLPIHLAITDENMKEKKIARVYELSILAREGEGGRAPQAPPFDGYWVGNNWKMRLDKL